MQSSDANESKINMQTDQRKPCKYIDASLLRSTENMQTDAKNMQIHLVLPYFKIQHANKSKHKSRNPKDTYFIYVSNLLILSLNFWNACLHDWCFMIAKKLFWFTLHACMIGVLWLHEVCFVLLCTLAWLVLCDCMIFVLINFAWLHDWCFVIAWSLFCLTLHDCMNLSVCVAWFYMWFHHMFLLDMTWTCHDLCCAWFGTCMVS